MADTRAVSFLGLARSGLTDEYNENYKLPQALEYLQQFADLKDYNGVAWYRKEFALPDPLPAGELTLRLSAIDDEDWTYLNGKPIGNAQTAARFGRPSVRVSAPVAPGTSVELIVETQSS